MGEEGPRPEQRELLKAVGEDGGLSGFVATSSGELAERLGVSQQTASRWILELKEDGLLERRLGSRGQQLKLTDEGTGLLADELERLQRIFDTGDRLELEGVVAAGDGEGRYYMSQPFYKEGFEELFGFEPFAGTLNLELEGSDLDAMKGLREREAYEIPQVTTPERTFGGVTGFPATVRGQDAAVVFPHRTRHEAVLEVISPGKLRDELGLEDGDRLTVTVDARPGTKTYQPRPSLLE
jgi:riboflavin kinase